ncbi:thioredoxin family protein [Aquimarina agarivorans]|uniref:thioredoxin family protein n=1 Tax=Aquimarina agarivorans TaxID=980584 RepID=UPI000248FCA1|nr:thioredoxin family protein [Aquimarina agarivorans]
MKKLLFIACFLFISNLFAQEINWMSMQDALSAQAENPKKIFMDVYTDWCGPCKLLDKKTFKHPDVVKYVNEHFYAVKFDAEGNDEFVYQGNKFNNPDYVAGKRGRKSSHIFARSLRISGYPSMVFFDEKSNLIFPVTGFHTAQQLEIFLKLIQSDDYKQVTSQKMFREYEKNFVGTFKG